jgi:ABC-type cobalamin/Fe3+-siderophores transport system ATPase subunit
MSKFYLEKIIIKNRAPFNDLVLDFNENEIAVLTAVNGKGKTTILSYIVDAWHEMARPHFHNEFEGKEKKYYRVASAIYDINQKEPSFVYIRFKRKYTENNEQKEECIDYVDVTKKCAQQQYNEAITIDDKILFPKHPRHRRFAQQKNRSQNPRSPTQSRPLSGSCRRQRIRIKYCRCHCSDLFAANDKKHYENRKISVMIESKW